MTADEWFSGSNNPVSCDITFRHFLWLLCLCWSPFSLGYFVKKKDDYPLIPKSQVWLLTLFCCHIDLYANIICILGKLSGLFDLYLGLGSHPVAKGRIVISIFEALA